MAYLLIAIGGTLGSLSRYTLGRIISETTKINMPVGTFFINITGAILLGILMSLDPGRNVLMLFGEGFLGAYTTFSTFMYEGFTLIQENEKTNALIYIVGSLVTGVLGFLLGLQITRII
jgi:CrcB protein